MAHYINCISAVIVYAITLKASVMWSYSKITTKAQFNALIL